MSDTSQLHERDAVVFLVWRGLSYGRRMAAGLGMLAAGLVLQIALEHWLPGCVLVLFGNALLLVRGYHNRIDPAVYDARAKWQQTDYQHVTQIKALHTRMKSWDRSAYDITSVWGALLLIVVGGMAALAVAVSPLAAAWKQIILINAALVFVPHWFTGTRRILKQPSLLIKIETFEGVLPVVEGSTVEWYVLIKGTKERMPQDVKIRVRVPEQREGFLGLYGQVAVNMVQGHSYPYLYSVLVAQKGFGLQRLAGERREGALMLLEYSQQDDVEVLVIRQNTKQAAGYYTGKKHARAIMAEGVRLTRSAL